MWHFNNERPKKQRYAELVSLKGKQNLKLKNNQNDLFKIQKINKSINANTNLSQNVVNILMVKLFHLSQQLLITNDLLQIEKLLDCINKCIENIKGAKQILN